MLDRSPPFWGKSKPRRWLARGQRPSRDSIIPTVSSPLSPPRAPAGLLWWEVFPNKERIKRFLSTPEEKQTPTALRSPAKNDGFLLLLLLKSLPGEIDQGTFASERARRVTEEKDTHLRHVASPVSWLFALLSLAHPPVLLHRSPGGGRTALGGARGWWLQMQER